MKVFRGNKVYIQKFDAVNLMKIISGLNMPVPDSVLMGLFGEGFFCSSDDLFDFVELEGQDAIEFFRKLDYIVDADTLEGKTIYDLTDMGVAIEKEIKNIIDDFNSKDENYRVKHYDESSTMCEAKRLQMCNIADYIHYLEGEINLNIPTGEPAVNPLKKESGVRKLVRSLFKKKD